MDYAEGVIIGGLAVLAIFLIFAVFARLFRKAGPHEALIVYGLRGTRVIVGGGTVDLPRWWRAAAGSRWS